MSTDRRSKLGVCTSLLNHFTPSPTPTLRGDFELVGSKVTGNILVLFLRHSDAFLQMLSKKNSWTLLNLIEPLC